MMSSVAGISTAAPSAVSEEVARDVLHDIAHELRQPLSAIESIAYYLTLVLPRGDDKVHDQLHQLQHLVEQSDWILSNGLHLAEPLAVSPEVLDFEELLTEVISSRGWPLERLPLLELAGNLPLVRVDPGLGRALVGNLLMLFRQLATESYPAILRTAVAETLENSYDPQATGGIALEMQTASPGHGSEVSLGPGGILSLESARRIAAAHGGSLHCTVDPMAGIRVRVMLP
jgi:light-regulated signal transduction histidine kinase (bacteriophytochrome)